MKFDLFLPKNPKNPGDPKAETAWPGQVAYIEVKYKKTSHFTEMGDRIIISSEAASAEECCDQIDELITDLRQLKAMAKRAFKRTTAV